MSEQNERLKKSLEYEIKIGQIGENSFSPIIHELLELSHRLEALDIKIANRVVNLFEEFTSRLKLLEDKVNVKIN